MNVPAGKLSWWKTLVKGASPVSRRRGESRRDFRRLLDHRRVPTGTGESGEFGLPAPLRRVCHWGRQLSRNSPLPASGYKIALLTRGLSLEQFSSCGRWTLSKVGAPSWREERGVCGVCRTWHTPQLKFHIQTCNRNRPSPARIALLPWPPHPRFSNARELS